MKSATNTPLYTESDRLQLNVHELMIKYHIYHLKAKARLCLTSESNLLIRTQWQFIYICCISGDIMCCEAVKISLSHLSSNIFSMSVSDRIMLSSALLKLLLIAP